MYQIWLVNDATLVEIATGFVQCAAEHCEEYNGRDNRLEAKEVLDFGVGDAQEWQLEEKVDQKSNHAI